VSIRIGVVELPGLVAALESAGVEVVTGEHYRAAAVAIRRALDTGEHLPVVASTKKWPGQKSWIERIATVVPVVVVRVPGGVDQSFAGIAADLGLPASLSEIIRPLGIESLTAISTLALDASGEPVAATDHGPAYTTPDEPEPLREEPVVQAPIHTPMSPMADDGSDARPAGPWPEFPAVAAALQHDDDRHQAPAEERSEAPSVHDDHGVFVEQVPVSEPVRVIEPHYDPTPVPALATQPDRQVIAPPSFAVDSARATAQGADLAEVIVVTASKGGVGKSTVSTSLAQRAAKTGGLRVILFDANFGQGDLRIYLKVVDAGMPSILDIALSGDLYAGLVGPDALNAARRMRNDPLRFAFVQAPPEDMTDPDVVTPEVYYNAVQQARRICDLVVVDTQIVETVDSSGMVDRFLLSLLHDGAYAVGLTDISPPGIMNLSHRLRIFAADGISRSRLITFMNRIPGLDFNDRQVATTLGEHSTFLGVVRADDQVISATGLGQSVCDLPVYAPTLDSVLSHVTGNQAFDRGAEQDTTSITSGRTRGRKPRRRWFR
jgi:cellulose biosynthesis protein BcsQ